MSQDPIPAPDSQEDPTDLTSWGHALSFEKPPHSMRLICQNPYGLDASTNYRKMDLFARNMAAYQVDIGCLPETNADWKQPAVLRQCHSALRKHLKHHRLITSCSDAVARHSYLSGGTATIAANNWTGRIASSGTDSHGLGRWSYVRVKGKNERRLLVITVYQVCKGSIGTAGDTTNFSHQWHILRARGDEHPNPRAQFSSDLSDLLLSFPDDHILIAGDINSWLGDANDDKNFSNLVLRHNLQDVLINKHGPASEIPTRKDGRRIDYIFASESVTQQVISCGALTYNRIVDSDHRALFIDLRIDELLEGSPPMLSSPALRGIDSKNPKLCVIYIEALTKYLGDHKVFSRTVKLETWTEEHGLTEGLKLLWEKLDRDVTAGCLHAERLARGRDRPPWSKDLHEAHLSVVYLKIAIRAMNKNTDSTEQLQAFLEHEADYTPPTVTTLPAALENLKLAKATLRAIQNNAKAFRETFLEERAAAAAAAKNITVEQAINAIIQRESTKRAFKTLRRYMRPDEFSPLTEVHIQKPDNSIEVVSEPSEMYSKIIERDLKHYNQAEGTPCTQNPVKQWLGASGTTPMCDSWLQGNAPPTVPSLAPETQAMLDNLRCNETPTPVDDRVTVDDYKEFFGKWDESTSTSQDRHLGHWKTLISHTAQNKYPEECDKIMHVLVKQMNLSLRHGYAWRRWKRIVCAKIPKRAGNMLLNKLRTIWLFEPDFNWLQGLVIGRRMIKAAETNKTLHDSQWGCRPGRHALGAVMLKVMSYEISRLTRSPLGSFDMDAASCFDRIIMALALLLCRREGVPSGTCIMAATVLMFAAFHIKTNHGVSYDWYSHSDDHPLHGPGQGSRIGPALWVLVSCLMFATMESLCHGAEFCNPSQTESHQRTGDGFVDDVANVFNCGLATMLSDDTITPEDISAGMQFEAQTWERLLWATGGALELSKCFYYILFYDFRKNGTPFLLAPHEMPGTDIHITSGDDPTPRLIAQKDCHEAHRTLGAHPKPSGCPEFQGDVSETRSNQITEGVRLSRMARNEALMGYRHIWLPSVGYALACVPVGPKQLRRIEKQAVNAFLPKMGFSSKSCRAVIFGSRAYGGYGLTRLCDYQGVNQTSILLQHVRLHDSIGKMILIGYAWHQSYCGVGYQILQQPATPLLHSLEGWFMTLREFLRISDMSIAIPPKLLRTPRLLRRGDINIMDAFCTLGLKKAQLRLLNYCRLFLQVETLAEISTADGARLLPTAWQGRTLPSSSTLLWPVQGRPNSWALWKQSLATLFLADTTTTYRTLNLLHLRTRLGRWHPHHSEHRSWPAYQTTLHLFLRHGGRYEVHRDTMEGRLPSRSFDATPHAAHLTPSTIDGATPADIQPQRRNRIQCMTPVGFFRYPDLNEYPDTPTTFRAHLAQLETWEKSLFPYFQATKHPFSLKEHLTTHGSSSLYIGHDGGATDRGAFGWCIASSTEIFWEGSGPTFGLNPGSFRSESYGMLAALRFLLQYIAFWQVLPAEPNKRHFEYTDSESLMKRLDSSLARFYQSPKACIASDYDLESAILATISELPLTFVRRHVKSHQDDDVDSTLELPWPAQLNVVCDHLASQQLSTCELHTVVPMNPYCNAYLTINDRSCSSHIRKAMFDAASSPRIREYLQRKFPWDDATFDSVEWSATHSALRGLTPADHRFVTKFVFKMLPLGARLRQRKAHIPSNCPTCEEPSEDDWHWITCPGRAEWRTQQGFQFSLFLVSLKTHPSITNILVRAYKSVLATGDCDFAADTYSEEEQVLVDSQGRIGWPHILFGRLSKAWSELQRTHVSNEELDEKKYSASRWTAKIHKYIWQRLHALWLLRNTSLHGTTFTENEATRRTRITPLVLQLYARRLELTPHDQIMLRMPVDTRLSQPLSTIETWLSVVTPAFDAARMDDIQDSASDSAPDDDDPPD